MLDRNPAMQTYIARQVEMNMYYVHLTTGMAI